MFVGDHESVVEATVISTTVKGPDTCTMNVYIIGVGQWGRLPPQAASSGGIAPTTRAIHLIVHHMKFMNKCSYKACSAYLTAYFSLNLSQKHLPPLATTPIVLKIGVV